MAKKKRSGSPMAQLSGKFPVNLGNDSSKRFNPKRLQKGHSSLAQLSGTFPVDLGADGSKRFTPKSP